MKLYDFHGSIPQNQIGKELRNIVSSSRSDFKVMTGYGSTSGVCKSKEMAMHSLRKMRKEGLIKAFLPAELLTNLLWSSNEFYQAKLTYQHRLTGDKDARYGNEGIIFVFVK